MIEFKIFTVPFDENKEVFLEEEVNKFCINKKIKQYKAEFFKKDGKSYWSIFIAFERILQLEKTAIIKDNNLSEEEKLLFKKLKTWQVSKAESKGLPTYIVCTNSQLLNVVRNKPKSVEALKNINGFGKSKIDRYGVEIVKIIKDFFEIK